MFKTPEQELLVQMQSLEANLILAQAELAKTNPTMAKAMFGINSKEVEELQSINIGNIQKLNQASNRCLLGLPSSAVMSKLSEPDMDVLSLDLLTDL